VHIEFKNHMTTFLVTFFVCLVASQLIGIGVMMLLMKFRNQYQNGDAFFSSFITVTITIFIGFQIYQWREAPITWATVVASALPFVANDFVRFLAAPELKMRIFHSYGSLAATIAAFFYI
jgi:hypothetical protein